MIMWIAALVLVALMTFIGYREGATRAAISFVGLLVGALLAIPLTPAFAWIFPLIGYKHPLVGKFGAPLIAFVVVSLAFKAIGTLVHRKVEYHYRYHHHDAYRAVWEVMHRRVGACIGVLNGTICFMVFALVISVFGYYTIQTGAGENESKVFSFLGKSAVDLQTTRMDEVVAPFNPVGEKYLDGADLAGLLYHNRSLVDRLYKYPVFASLAEEGPYRALGSDKALQSMIKSQASLNEILSQPGVQEVVSNTDIATRVMDLDFKDLHEYLKTGVSAKYAQEKILGTWGFDELATLQLNKKLRPEVLASAWFRLKSELGERFDKSEFTAFHDNKTKFQLTPNMEGRGSPFTAGARLPNGQTNYVARWFTTNASYSAVGKWSGTAPNYLVTLGNRNGTASAEGKLEGSQLSFQFEGKALSFTRLEE